MRRNQDPQEGAQYLSQVVGRRIREVRRGRVISQDELARRMVEHGHETWKRQTVGLVEKAERGLTVDELVSLAAALPTSVAFLMSPTSAYDGETAIDVGRSAPVEGAELREIYGFIRLPVGRYMYGGAEHGRGTT